MAEKYNIVYYMGASASAMGIPVVADFKWVPASLDNFLSLKIREDVHKYSYLQYITDVLRDFSSDFEKVSSMDTLAKRIYQLSGDNKQYRRYKLFLQLVFCFQHFSKLVRPEDLDDLGIRPNYSDPRYENLIRTIGETTDDLYKGLKVEIPDNFSLLHGTMMYFLKVQLLKIKN